MARVNEVDLYFEEAGDGPRVLFLNGSGATLATAAPILDRVRGDLDVLAFDARGLGRSGAVAAPYAMADLAADALALLDHVGWSTCRVLGISFGGMLAQEVAVTAPDRVERLALLCTSPGGVGGSSYPSTSSRICRWRNGWPNRCSSSTRASRPSGSPSTRWTTPSCAPVRPPPPRRCSDEQVTGERLQLAARAHHDVSGRLDRITCPTLVACGSLRRHRAGEEQRVDGRAHPRREARGVRGRAHVLHPGPDGISPRRRVPARDLRETAACRSRCSEPDRGERRSRR